MPLKKSWIESANRPNCQFPLNNLPYGVFGRGEDDPVCGVAIGDYVLDLAVLEAAGLLDFEEEEAIFALPFLNGFMEMGAQAWAVVRAYLTDILADGGSDDLSGDPDLKAAALVPMKDVTLYMPILVAEFTDFYAGMQHAKNVGEIMRGSDALPANWLHIPIGYNGRSSSIYSNEKTFKRPLGQMKPANVEVPYFGPSEKVDYELELGAIVGVPTEGGAPITTAEADALIFGYVLLNDWSSRDIQGWEYQPLGPFQGKAFGTSIGVWVVPKAALEPFRCETPDRETPLLPYLAEGKPGLFDIDLEVTMQPEGAPYATTICKTNYKHMYYSFAQQLAHHAVGGCPMNTGDLIGSGTISGPVPSQYGSLLEKSWGGRQPFTLDTGEERTFIEDGDCITLKGQAKGDGYVIGFGECKGWIVAAADEPDWDG